MSQYGYGGGARNNPYDQRGIPSPQYGAPYSNAAPSMGRDDYATQNVEMEPLTKNASDEFSRGNPNAILDACRDVDRGIQEIRDSIRNMQEAQRAYLNDASTNPNAYKQVEAMNTATIALYRNLISRVKNIKQKPESGSPRNSPQVGKVDRALKETFQEYQNAEAEFRRRMKDQAARQLRIVDPNITDEAIDRAVDDGNQQVFAQALLQGNRSGQSQQTLNAVKQRSEAIKKIERQIIELAELFQDMDNLVMQQEAAVVNIEQKGEEVVENMDKGTEQIGVAIKSARNARKWKWWCLGICVLIIAIIVIIVLIYKFVIQNNNTTTVKTGKRSVATEDSLVDAAISSLVHKSKRYVIPGSSFFEGSSSESSPVVVRKMRSFQA